MEKRKKSRISVLETVNGWMNVEMSELRETQLQTSDRLQKIEGKLKEIDGEISEAEHTLRSVIDTDANLALEEYKMLIAYLDHKQRIRINNERQHGFIRDQLEKVENEMIQQGLKMRGMENLLERRLREMKLDKEYKQLSVLDEAWVQKQRDDA